MKRTAINLILQSPQLQILLPPQQTQLQILLPPQQTIITYIIKIDNSIKSKWENNINLTKESNRYTKCTKWYNTSEIPSGDKNGKGEKDKNIILEAKLIKSREDLRVHALKYKWIKPILCGSILLDNKLLHERKMYKCKERYMQCDFREPENDQIMEP